MGRGRDVVGRWWGGDGEEDDGWNVGGRGMTSTPREEKDIVANGDRDFGGGGTEVGRVAEIESDLVRLSRVDSKGKVADEDLLRMNQDLLGCVVVLRHEPVERIEGRDEHGRGCVAPGRWRGRHRWGGRGGGRGGRRGREEGAQRAAEGKGGCGLEEERGKGRRRGVRSVGVRGGGVGVVSPPGRSCHRLRCGVLGFGGLDGVAGELMN